MPADSQEDLELAVEFDQVTRDRWRSLVNGVLAKGARDLSPDELDRRFAKILESNTYDGLTIEPLYDRNDVRALPDPGFPGESPFVRGRTPLGSALAGWDVCQRVEVDAEGLAAGPANAELEGGATSLWLGVRAAPTIAAPALAKVLEGTLLDLITVRLDAGPATSAVAEVFFEVASEQVSPTETRAGLGFDPLGWCAHRGRYDDLTSLTAGAVDWAIRCDQSYPQVRAIVADGSIYESAGGSDAEELGCALATGVSYLREMTAAGLSIDAALGQIELRLAATVDQFSTIAKMRAARRLWDRVGEVTGARPETRVPPIHAVTSPAMLSIYDPWVNLLRTTVACFSAGVGGADSITVLPYDFLSVGPASSELGRRLARNIHALLLDESHLTRVVDLAGGSWFVESLTDGLAHKAWDWFQTIEAAGGMDAALRDGLVGDKLKATWDTRARRLATGADPLTGVSEFPNVAEATPSLAAIEAALNADSNTEGLPLRRLPAAFEAVRARSDRHLASEGKRPAILIATIGSPATYTARTTFAQNLFGVAGVESVQPDPGEGPAWAAALQVSGARLACICSDDSTYADHAARVAKELKEAGVARVYLAGRPGELEAEWRAAGVDEFVFQGSDRLDVLSRALDAAGVR